MLIRICNIAVYTWNSPTFVTWFGFLIRSLNLVVVLPLALRHLPPEDSLVWQLLVSVVTLQYLLDTGLTPTFSRIFARTVTKLQSSDQAAGEPMFDWERIEDIWRTLHKVYLWPTVIGWLVLGPVSALLMRNVIGLMTEPWRGWLVLLVVIVVSPLVLPTMGYSAYLLGLNQVALVRRWEGFAYCGAAATSLLVILGGGGLVALVIGSQCWVIFGWLRNRMLCLHVAEGRARRFGSPKIIPLIWREVWPAAWRSGVGVLITGGLIQISGFVYSFFGEIKAATGYLVSLRYLTAISQFSQVPFYSKLPRLAQLHAADRLGDMLLLAQRGMKWAHITYAFGAVMVGWCLPLLLRWTGSRVPSAEPMMWWLLVVAILGERIGAMHLQLYSVTNIIVWHIAAGVSCLIIVLISSMLFQHMGEYSFPTAMIVGYGGFFCAYCMRKSYRAFHIPGIGFELNGSVLAILGIACGGTLHLWVSLRS